MPYRISGYDPQVVEGKVHASVYLSSDIMNGTDILSATQVCDG